MELAILAALILGNAVLAMSEIAIVSSRKMRLSHAAERGDRRAASALALVESPTRFLSTVQVGITIVGVFAGAFGEKAIASDVAEWLRGFPRIAPAAEALAFAIVVGCIAYVSLIFGELVPKRIAMTRPEAIARFVAPPMTLLSIVASPVVKVLSLSTDGVLALLRVRTPKERDAISEDEVRAMIEKGAETGVFEEAEQELVQGVFRLGDLPVRAFMVPRNDVVWLRESDSPQRIRVAVASEPFSHFPVCRSGLDDLVGIVHVKDLVRNGLITGGEIRLGELAQPPIVLPDTTLAIRALETLRDSRTHVGMVVNEYGSIVGLVTLNDLLQAIVGSMSRTGEREAPSAVRREDGSWLVDGRMTIHDMLVALEIEIDEKSLPTDVHTVAGLVLDALGHLPRAGETTRWRGLRFEVVDMDGQRIDKVVVDAKGKLGAEGRSSAG